MPNSMKRFIPVIVILAAALSYGIYYILQTSSQNSGLVVSGTIEVNEIHLGAAAGGVVDRMFVYEGDPVRKDQLLAYVKSVSGGTMGIIRSPIDGVVLVRAAEPGEVLTAGGALLVVADLSRVTLTVYVPEDRYGQVTLGQSYPITVDSFPGRVFWGEVTSIAGQAEFTPRNVQTVQGRKNTVYAVKLSAQNPDLELKPGMPADVTLASE